MQTTERSTLNPVEHWPEIRRVFAGALRTSMHYAVASVDGDGCPHITPIGSIMLTSPGRGIFFQQFSTGLPKRLRENPRFAILAVNASAWFWARSLFQGHFVAPPGIRLGARILGPPRPATPQELKRFERRVWPFKPLRGYELLWRGVGARTFDFEVVTASPLQLGAMTRKHWQAPTAARREPLDTAA